MMKSGIAFSLMLLLFSLTLSAESVRISTVEGLPLSEICSYILKKVYEKSGLELEVFPMPPARATIESTSGRIDGETHRIESYGDSHRELIMVPFPYYSIKVIMYTNADNPARNCTYEELGQYRFAILRGIKNSKDLTADFPLVQESDDTVSMFRLLEKGRTDFVVTSNVHGEYLIRDLGLEGIASHEIPLSTTDLYHFLHKDHADLVPIIEKTMREMSLSGELNEIVKDAEDLVIGTP